MSSRRVFSSQGSSPLDSLKVVTGGGAVKVEYDRSIRANALSFAGEVSQCKIQIPRDAGKGPLSSWPVVAFVVFLSGSDLQIEIDTVASVSLVQLSATGAQVSHPVLRKMSQKVSFATFHHDKEKEGTGKGVCKLALNVPRGQWCIVALDMAVILADYCASVAANESQSSAPASSAPNAHFGARSRPSPPNLFSKTPRFAATVAGLALDRIVLSGAAKMKEIIVASDLLAADMCTKDLRLPLVLLPETPVGSGAMGAGVGVGGLQLGANGVGLVGASLQPSVAGGPSITAVGANAMGNGRAFSKGEGNLAQQHSTPLRSIQVQQQGLSSSNDLLGVKGSANASSVGRPLFQVKFTRDADGKVAVAAKDLELERRIFEEKEAEELAKEMKANRLQVEAVLAREEAENSYRRLIEPEMPAFVDRFGVAKPSAAERAAAAAAARSAAAAAADPLLGGLGAWSDDADAGLLPLSPQKRKGPSNSPSTSSNTNANNRKQQNNDVSAQQGQSHPAHHKRISYLPQRKPFFRSKLGEPCPEAPPLPPAPSSLLLTSVMKRPLTAQHAADGVRMVRTPPAGTTRAGQGDAGQGVTANSVFTGRVVGYGVGCLDILHCGSDDDSDDDDDETTDNETTDDDDDDDDDDDEDDEDEDK